jgi:hypothetical protein
MMRIALVFLVACSLHVAEDDQLETCAGDAPPGSCQCSNGSWLCTTCSFFEGSGPVACSQPGASCQIETWEHGCDCSCGSDGWWDCFAETVGSQCPHPPFHDAGIDGPPDAIPIDAAACSRVEAETIGVHPGWDLLSGQLSGGYGLINAGNVALHLNVTGTTLAVNRELGPNTGPLAISIDGGAPIVVQGAQSTFSFVTLPVASGLANTEHQVSATCESNFCSIDFFDVTCP